MFPSRPTHIRKRITPTSGSHAQQLFDEGRFGESVFELLAELQVLSCGGVVRKNDPDGRQFSLLQGPVKIDVSIAGQLLSASADIAVVSEPSGELLRFLLDQNYFMKYCRLSLAGGVIRLQYDGNISIAGLPAIRKALREIAITAESQDVLLRRSFPFLRETATATRIPSGRQECAIKARWFSQWLSQAIGDTREMDPVRHGEGVSIILTTMLYRVLYLLRPEGRLLAEVREILRLFQEDYWKPMGERNQTLLQGINALTLLPVRATETFAAFPRTFSDMPALAANTLSKTCRYVKDHMPAYRNNQFAHLENQFWEHPLAFCGYHAHIPELLSGFVDQMYRANYPAFFREMGRELEAPELHGDKLTKFNSSLIRVLSPWRFPADHPLIAWITRT